MKPQVPLERLPHSKEAEIAFLGAILVGRAPDPEELKDLEWTDFCLPFHRVIFRHMKGLRAAGKPVNDLALLAESLESLNEVEAAGGIDYISGLIDGRQQVSNLHYYLETIQINSQARAVLHMCQSNIQRILGANGDLADVLRDIANSSGSIDVRYGQTKSGFFKTASELAKESRETEFVVQPYLAAGAITDLVAKIKIGKTTFALGELVRKALAKGPVVYLTEQPQASFQVALQRAGLLDATALNVMPFNKAIGWEWLAIAREATKKCLQEKAILLVIDTLSYFAGLEGDAENDSGAAITCMKPLQEVAFRGIGVLTLRHERKSGGEVGDAGRGSSAFGGAADTLLTLRRTEGRTRPTLRKIECISRFEGLPSVAIYEYTNGLFRYVGTENDVAEREAEAVILAAAPASEEEAKELSALIEGSHISRTTTQRVIWTLKSEGRLMQIGTGKRGSPFRFFRTEKTSAQTSSMYGQKAMDPEEC